MNTYLKFNGYKCFSGDDGYAEGFEIIKSINIIIGANNSGKSRLIDFIESLHKNGSDKKLKNLKIYRKFYRGKSDIDHLFPGWSGGWVDYCRQLLPQTYEAIYSHEGRIISFDGTEELIKDTLARRYPWKEEEIDKAVLEVKKKLSESSDFFPNRRDLWPSDNFFKRIDSERDIKRERSGICEDGSIIPPKLLSNGTGATDIIHRFLHLSDEKYPRFIITDYLLDAVNEIFRPTGLQFTEIYPQLDKDNYWEIYLGQKDKNLIPLSDSGSGIKTILLVLLNLIAIPCLEQNLEKDLSSYTFAFEELENNLHPTLLRSLLLYIEKMALSKNATFFLTTHSSIVLDIFNGNDSAQIIHVWNDGKQSTVRTVSKYMDNIEVINNLGAKPSDLLQANGIIWLEGPSDRIYINKWIELMSDGELKESRHYQCAFYGGALLSHSNFNDPNIKDDERVKMLKINYNAILVGDGDRFKGGPQIIKNRLLKAKEELESMGGIVWVTEAKEIENYIPGSILSKIFRKDGLPSPSKNEPFSKVKTSRNRVIGYLQKHVKGFAEKNDFNKIDLAEKVIELMSQDNMSGRFDWFDEMERICSRIRKWNSLPNLGAPILKID